MTNVFSLRHSKLLFGVALLSALLLGFVGGMPARASAADCDDNAIIKCGFSSKADFIKTVRDNNSGNGHHDLKAIYDHYGLESADYDRFVTSARPGTAYQDGRIVVDGQTVATNAKSIGRLASYQGAGYFSTTISGTTYYGNTNDQAFKGNSLPVMVMFNDKGVMEFAVINSCGNPIYGVKNVPTYSCNKLHKQAVDGKPGTFTFSTSASAGQGATITKVVYDFGDKTPKVTMDNPSQPVTHTYTVGGTYTASVTVIVSLPGNSTIQVTSADCATQVVVALPFYQCTALAATTIDGSKYKYKFVVTGKAGNGATLTTADFVFGDGKSTNGVSVAGGTTATTTHTYTKDGSYNFKATFHVALPGGKTTTTSGLPCAKKIPVAIPYFSCIQLTGAVLDKNKFSFSFTVSADFGNGATFKSADFDFGDHNVTNGVKPTGTSATTTHQYGAAGNYRIVATLHFSVGSAIRDVQCAATVTPTQPPTPECKPGVPQGSALCAEVLCATNSSVPATDESCALPNTGAGSFVALFGAAVVAGFFIFRQFVYKKQAFAAAGITYVPPTATDEPDEGHEPVVIKPAERNRAHSLHHPSYHQPHRFRPRSHHEHDEE